MEIRLIDDNPIRLAVQNTCTLSLSDLLTGEKGGVDTCFIVLRFRVESQDEFAFPEMKVSCSNGSSTQTILYSTVPNVDITLNIPLRLLKNGDFFLPPSPGVLKSRKMGTSLWEPRELKELRIGISGKDEVLRIDDIRLSDERAAEEIFCEQPAIDSLGQYKPCRWKNKSEDIHSNAASLQREYKAVPVSPEFGAGYSRHGGWTDIFFEKTGYFHTAKAHGKWWLVDPDGYAFFSHGICYALRTGEYTFVDGMRDFYEWLPGTDDPTYQKAWITSDKIDEYVRRNGTDSKLELFSFCRANLIRAFGPEWPQKWRTLTVARMKKWGINTVGFGINQFRDERLEDIEHNLRMPYALTLKGFPQTRKMIFRDFPDVFSKEYEANAVRFAQQLAHLRDDPCLIGYFMKNEPDWIFDNDSVVCRMLENGAALESKTAMTAFLRNRYDSVAALNAAWNVNLPSFDAFAQHTFDRASLSADAHKDIADFEQLLLNRYIETPARALRQVDPHHLNLGMRYSSIHPLMTAGSEFYDVMSFNHYVADPYDGIQKVGAMVNKPVLIGEYHFSALDAGLPPSPILPKVYPTQMDRGRAYRFYNERAFATDYCVGAHYFEYNDQPRFGRFDGENYQIGFVDICSQPYFDFVQEVEACSCSLKDLALAAAQAKETKTR